MDLSATSNRLASARNLNFGKLRDLSATSNQLASARNLNIPKLKQGKLAVMTSGGDAQGMNGAVRSVTRNSILFGRQVVAIYEGFHGLVNNNFKELEWDSVSGFLEMGGTAIGTTRCLEYKNDIEIRKKAAYNLIINEVTDWIVIGGDGSLTGANTLREEWETHVDSLLEEQLITEEQAELHAHIRVIGIVGSIDNDIPVTDMTIGADSALNRIIESIDCIVTTASSHQRTFIVEVMGRHCGYLALLSALATGADWVFIPECPVMDWEDRLATSIEKRRSRGMRHSLIIVAEGASDSDGNPISVNDIKNTLDSELIYDTRISVLGHVQRGGFPSAHDRTISTLLGAHASKISMKPLKNESEGIMVRMQGNDVTTVALSDCIESVLEVNKAMEARDWEQVLRLRGKAFTHALSTLRKVSRLLPHSESGAAGETWGIIHVGAPAPGMNGVVRGIVRLGLDLGYNIIGFKQGFEGAINGKHVELHWTSVNNWTYMGGAILETSRMTPEQAGLQAVSDLLENIDKLIIIGGWEAYISALQIQNNRQKYPGLNKHVVVIPSTISNNCPGTEYSVGCDTALNVIVNSCDSIKQSGMSSGCRIFLIQIMGGRCGYLTLLGSIAGGMYRIY
eukprot:TRINITY_DN5906_c0_g1_i4.p1 TRINITY_DN5906_c0_g1~~TRINITY_DN5906_c0_g1_i4.p1  ORF type:complete len:623 (-),score=144.58 TRINITY_DN5906_c0_g1_i4:610-2478(-)